MRNMEKNSRRRWHPSYVFLGVINSFNYKIRVWCLTVLSKHKPWGTLVTDFAKRLGSLALPVETWRFLACGSVGLPYMVVGCGGISLNWGTWNKLLDFFENAIGIFFTYKSSPD